MTKYRYTMSDLQKATGLKPDTFGVWKAQNNKQLTRGLGDYWIYNPEEPSRKLFTKAYLDRIVALRAGVKTRAKTKKTTGKPATQTRTVQTTAKTTKAKTDSYLVNLKPDQSKAFEAIAKHLGWATKHV